MRLEWDVAVLLLCLPSVREAPGSIPSTVCFKVEVVAQSP